MTAQFTATLDGYAMVDDILPKQAWEMLRTDPAAQLVDVRTEAEWQTIGLPDLTGTGKHLHCISWQYPTGEVNAEFVAQLRAGGLRTEDTLLFLCRSGVRSLAAGEAAQQAGYAASFNVAYGFEGPPYARGRAGWKADDLPWVK